MAFSPHVFHLLLDKYHSKLQLEEINFLMIVSWDNHISKISSALWGLKSLKLVSAWWWWMNTDYLNNYFKMFFTPPILGWSIRCLCITSRRVLSPFLFIFYSFYFNSFVSGCIMHSCCSQNTILVDGVKVHSDDTIVIKDGSQIIPGPNRECQILLIFMAV